MAEPLTINADSRIQAAKSPLAVAPMLATSALRPPAQPGWAFEHKWDGVRAIVVIHHGKVTLSSRLGNDITDRYPELQALAGAFPGTTRTVVLDGEVVALDTKARPSFSLLQRRMHVTNRRAIPRLMREAPVLLMIFDLLQLDDRSLLNQTYDVRREALHGLDLRGEAWQTPPAHLGDGALLLAAAKKLDFEGIIAKRRDSIYQPGRRSDAWRKIKLVSQQELVIGGWTPGLEDPQALGALLMGYHDDQGQLRFAGRVGTGFTREHQQMLLSMLRKLRQNGNPYADVVPHRDAIFVKPQLVAQINVRQWTHDGILRHASYQGLRDDKKAEDVVLEPDIARARARSLKDSQT